MSHSHLTNKYRPQSFGDVAGQDTIKSILSRASLVDNIAPAYLFSGTRGVGKTTIARIFAKALNCINAPAAEPCNECIHCQQITAGAAVDVAEIDGASHTGVDNIRSLREDVGYAPIECRYKVFIIDEAHMLSNSAFNALLKTLEEPPGHVTFIMATTEPHKFPATIISRCQHYSFGSLSQKEMELHLSVVLSREGKEFAEEALSLIVRRGGGSVRDSMSLLGQVLALGDETLTAQAVRQVLGLAGRELLFRLLEAIHSQDCIAVLKILTEIFDQGLDLGFFLRELTACWRNLFLLSQSGEAALSVLEVSESESALWKHWSTQFSLTHIHACWQLTLEGQRKVKDSLEPALALELLLLNLTCLPQLLSLDRLSGGGSSAAGGGRGMVCGSGQKVSTDSVSPPQPAGGSGGQVTGSVRAGSETNSAGCKPALQTDVPLTDNEPVKDTGPALQGEQDKAGLRPETIESKPEKTGSLKKLNEQARKDPLVKSILETFDARIIHITPVSDS